MEQSKVLHQLKRLLLLYCYIVILLGFWLICKNPVFAGTYPPCVVDDDCLGDESCVNCPEDCGFCPVPPGSSALPSPSASGSPAPPGSSYIFCGTGCCPGAPSPCDSWDAYELYCWPSCDQNAQICYRKPECYQPCLDCAICGCGEAPVVGEVPSCADIDLCGKNHCDHETGECHSVCFPCAGPSSTPTPTPTPTPSPASRPNIVSLYHMSGTGTPRQIALNRPATYRATYEDASIVVKPTNSLVANGSFENGSTGWDLCSDPAGCSIETGDSIYGSHSLRLRRETSGDAYYVSDWIDAGFELRNQNVTLSFDVSTPSGNNIIYDNALQTYPTGGDWNKSKYLSRWSQTPTLPNWRRQIFQLTFPSDVPKGERLFRIVLRPPNQINVDAYFDGIMVERGHTVGLYTDIYAAQFNLERDNQHTNLVINGSFEDSWTGWNYSSAGTKQLVSDSFYGDTAVYVTGSGARVIQWVPIKNNTTYTASLTVKGSGGGKIAADEWCLGGSSNVYIKGRTFSKGSNYQRNSWVFNSGNCGINQDHRLAIYFDTYNSNDKIWADGILLEEGGTEGIFLSQQEWPFRALFRPDEGFRLREPSTGVWTSPVAVAYDEDNFVWYLPSDIVVSDSILLGRSWDGVPQTFVRSVDDDLVIDWQFKLGSNFPIKTTAKNSWYVNLFVRDKLDQDDNVLNLGLKMFNLNGWNFHRIEEVNIVEMGNINGYVWYDLNGNGNKDSGEGFLSDVKVEVVGYGSDITDSGGNYNITDVLAGERTVVVTPPANWECTTGCSKSVTVTPGGAFVSFGLRPYRGTIRGNVYHNDVCQCTGNTASPNQSWIITCSGDGIDGVLNGNTSSYSARKINNSTYECISTSGSNQLPYGSYTIIFTSASTGWIRAASCGTSRSPVNLNASSVSVSPHFYQCQPADPWWQSVGGNIHSQDEVRSNVPSGQYLISGSKAIVSYGSNLSIFNGSISTSGWAAHSHYQGPEYNYIWWLRQFKEQSKKTGSDNLFNYTSDGVYVLSGTTLHGNLPNNRKVVILKDGNLTIDGNIDVPVGSFLMVISSGTISVNNNLGGSVANPVAEGIFIANKINFGSGSVPLFAAGNFIAWSSANDSITIGRNIGGTLSLTIPSATFISRSDLILNAPDFVKKINYNWQQIPG